MNIKEIIIVISIAVGSLLLGYISKITLRKSKKLHLNFLGSFLQTAFIVLGIVLILNKFPSYQKFSNTVLMSSSLLVAVLGFAFQTPLSDIVSGIFISLFRPFEVGDRVTLKTENITGIIESISIRHTVIKSFTNSRLIIPNHLANQEIIENSNIEDSISANFLDVTVSYESDISKAKDIMKNVIIEHSLTLNEDDADSRFDTFVYTRMFGENGIELRASVWTKNVSDNFLACSDIRDAIIKEFKNNNIAIPYHRMEIINN